MIIVLKRVKSNHDGSNIDIIADQVKNDNQNDNIIKMVMQPMMIRTTTALIIK